MTFGAVQAGRYGAAELMLAQQLARRSAVALDNGRLYREAVTAVAMRNKFLASIAHDLRNPLTVIYGYVQSVRSLTARSPNFQTSDMTSSLDRINDMTMRMKQQLSELADLAQLEEGQPLDLRPEPTDLVGLVRRAVGEQQQVTSLHRIRFDASEASLVGQWDGARLERVVMNLLANAVKYSPNGGEIKVFVGREGEKGKTVALLEVHDHGLGIPQGEVTRIFEQFHRASNVLGRISGWGIGLANVKEIVEQHRGTVEVSSEEGKGSTFTVRLPL
jgi:signal transduction histidine kinase